MSDGKKNPAAALIFLGLKSRQLQNVTVPGTACKPWVE